MEDHRLASLSWSKFGWSTLAATNYLRFRLWHCRLIIVSLVLGVAAMSLPQVQDLFIEPRGVDGPIVLTLMVLLFWSIPANRAALRMVSQVKDRPPAESLFCTIVDEWLPRLLGLAPFIIVGVALPGLATSIDGLGALPEQAVYEPYTRRPRG